jgi:capsule polysaccharide export protein KpsE/RkpR
MSFLQQLRINSLPFPSYYPEISQTRVNKVVINQMHRKKHIHRFNFVRKFSLDKEILEPYKYYEKLLKINRNVSDTVYENNYTLHT